jgi:hypothetical protein
MMVVCFEFESKRLIGAITPEELADLLSGAKQMVAIQYPVEVVVKPVSAGKHAGIVDRKQPPQRRVNSTPSFEIRYMYLPTSEQVCMTGDSMMINVTRSLGFYVYDWIKDQQLNVIYSVEVDGVVPTIQAPDVKQRGRFSKGLQVTM